MNDTKNHFLLGLFDSPYVRRVAIAMSYYDVAFDHQSLSVFRHVEAMTPVNPLLRVPLLITPEGDRLHESAFILDYLDDVARGLGKTTLIPAAGRARMRVWQHAAHGQAAADKAAAIYYEQRRPADKQWPDWLNRLRSQFNTAMQLLEDALRGERFVEGLLTHADIMAAVAVSFVRYTIPDEWTPGRFPKLEALMRELEETPAFRAVPIDKS